MNSLQEQPITTLFTDAGVVTREDLQEMTKGSQELLIKPARTWKELRALVTELRGEVIAYVRLYRQTKEGLALTEREYSRIDSILRETEEVVFDLDGALPEDRGWVNLPLRIRNIAKFQDDAIGREKLKAAKAEIELDGVKKALDITDEENAKLRLAAVSDRFMWFPVALVAGLIGWFLGRIV
jgi:hypothetical protein